MDSRSLYMVFKYNTKIKTGLIYPAASNKLSCFLLRPTAGMMVLNKAHRSHVNWIFLEKGFANKKLIKLLHLYKYKIGVWTVNNHQTIKKMRQYGVDAIISNFSDRL